MQNSDNQSYMAQDNLRLEIAILQDDIKSQDPKCARFKIPAIMTGDEVGRTHASMLGIIMHHLKILPIKIFIDVNLLLHMMILLH